MVPLGDGRKHLAVEVRENLLKAFTRDGRVFGQGIHKFAGLHDGQHGKVTDVDEVVGNPLDAGVSGEAEVFNVTRPGFGILGIRQV